MWPTCWVRALTLCVLGAMGAVLGGCSEVERTFTIRTQPAPAQIKIDGSERGLSPVREKLVFNDSKQSYVITANRPGFKERRIEIDRNAPDDLVMDLPVLTRRVTINVVPAAAEISIDGRVVSVGPVPSYSTTLTFGLDKDNRWTTYQVVAKRPGWEPTTRPVTWTDPQPSYLIELEPLHKDVTVSTSPPGAKLFLNGSPVGVSPMVIKALAFHPDPETSQWNQYTLTAVKPGYDPVEATLGWEEGRREYQYTIKPKQKVVRILSSPPGAVMSIDGKELPRDADGASTELLIFVPNEDGTLGTFTVNAGKNTPDSDWEPAKLVIGWDNAKTQYGVTLREITEVEVALLQADPHRTGDTWTIAPKWAKAVAMKALIDPRAAALKEAARRIRALTELGQLDTLAVSPDGLELVASVLSNKGDSELRAQIVMFKSDGSDGTDRVTDGRSLDLHPSFTPDGKQIIYSSNRGGRRQSIWSVSATGQPGISKLTSGETSDLWPSVDETRHLYYEAMVDSRSDPRIFVNELGKTLTTDVTQEGGSQPHVNAAADTLLYVAVNAKTGKRDLFKMSLKDGVATNLTHSADSDNFDPVWSPSGDRIAFVSDRGSDLLGRHNLDIWVMDPAHPDQAAPVTTNGSQDDCPAWDTKDPTGNAIYFRSNRGGEWGIWRAGVK